MLARLFLALNGVPIAFEPEDAVRMVLQLAAGDLDEEGWAEWFRARLALSACVNHVFREPQIRIQAPSKIERTGFDGALECL